MSRPISPIERMIDAATGYQEVPLPPAVELQCPTCGARKHVARDEIDPPNAALVKYPCGKCPREGFNPEYFDNAGNLIQFP